MTRSEAEAMARKILQMPHMGKLSRLADAFEAAYDDGVRDERGRQHFERTGVPLRVDGALTAKR
jgi:hypothetical protein